MFSLSPSTSSALFGALLNFLLFGMLIVQVCASFSSPVGRCVLITAIWQVYMRYASHRTAAQSKLSVRTEVVLAYLPRQGFYTVWTVFVMMLISICFNAVDAHFWYAANFGDLTAFGEARFSAFYTPIIGSLVGLLVQGFFAYRISIFRGAGWVAGLITLVGFFYLR
jgi:hypothetical protein